MKNNQLKLGDLVVLKTSWIIIYKLVKIHQHGLQATCINFRGEHINIPVYNLEKYNF